MFFRSIRFRLTLWYTLPLAAFMVASGFFWHFYLSENLLRNLEEKLLIIGEDLAYDLRSLQALGLVGSDTCAAFNDFVGRHPRGELVQVLKGDGTLFCASPDLNFRLPLSASGHEMARDGIPSFESVSPPGSPELRVLTYPLAEAGHLERIIQIAVRQTEMEETLADLRLTFFIFFPLLLLALAIGGWFMAGRALSPMVRMARAARQITADSLALRLPVEQSGNEIAKLAENFNAMLARLEESFRKVKQFSGDASHELRTPLAILRGETEVSLRWARSADDYRRTLESNLEEIDRMGRIIDDLLTLAKSDSGELPLEIKDLSLSDLLQELYLQGNTLGEARDISVVLHLDVAEEIRIRGDELRLRQIFLNLISNGIKYTPPGGRVDITLAVQGEEAVVQISDTGIGIQAEHLPYIFDRFYRIDKARNRADGGTGLGLAISKSIVESHAGRIVVDSTPGKGSTFNVYLPVQGPPPKNHRQGTKGPYCAIMP